MANVTVYVDALVGITIYVKPADSNGAPLVTSPWSSDVINGSWDLDTLRWSFSLPDDGSYLEYQMLGGSPADTDTEVGAIIQTVAAGTGADTTPGTTLLVDYSGDWVHIDGVEDAGYEIGPQRVFRTSTPTAPSSGVKVRRGNPTKADMITATAMGVRLESTDMALTLWSETLADGSVLIEPARGDFFVLSDGRARILNLTRMIDGAQWRCFCRFASE